MAHTVIAKSKKFCIQMFYSKHNFGTVETVCSHFSRKQLIQEVDCCLKLVEVHKICPTKEKYRVCHQQCLHRKHSHHSHSQQDT